MEREPAVRNHPDWIVTGQSTIHGGTYRRVGITGEAVINDTLTCERMKLTGRLDASGDLHADEIKVLGELSVKGNCSSESIQVRGTIAVEGLLNTGNLEIRLYGPSKAKEIGGSVIRVKKNLRGLAKYKHLTVDTLEGDDIRVEYTRAKIVRGKHVEIGPGCDIEMVEYKENYSVSRKANVKEFRKV